MQIVDGKIVFDEPGASKRPGASADAPARARAAAPKAKVNAVVKPAKGRPVVKATNVVSYNPDTFAELVPDNFYVLHEVPDDFVEHIVPFTTELLPGKKFITFDTETTVKYPSSYNVPEGFVRRWVGSGKSATPQDVPFVVSICDANACYTIYDSEENGWANFYKLRPLFENPAIDKVAQNIHFDMHILHNIGIKLKGQLHDTVILAKLANENRNSFALVDLVHHKGGISVFEDMLANYKSAHRITNYKNFPDDLLGAYANADIYNCKVAFFNELKTVVADELLPLYQTEIELGMALYEMERHGMKIDESYEVPLKTELQTLVDTSEQAVYDAVGYMFNMNSNQQLHKALLSVGTDPNIFSYTDKGNVKLDKNELERLSSQHGVDLVDKLLEFRKAEKLLNTYANGIYSQRDSAFKVHCNINSVEATTGRMSITKPALQTLNKKDTRIRKMFLPTDDQWQLVFMDLDQIEYRYAAHYSKAEGLIDAIKKGHDIHLGTAALVYNKPMSEVTKEERQRAKTLNFSLIYGQGDEALANSLKVPISEAREFKAKYFGSLPELKPFIATVHQVNKMRGYIKNFYGRRRRLKPDESFKAPNALIQGVSADYIKSKMVLIYRYLKANKLQTRMLLPIHDEIVFEFHKSELEHIPIVRWLLSDFKTFRVPITAGVEYGNPSWGEKIEDDVDCGFREPDNFDFLNYNVFNGGYFANSEVGTIGGYFGKGNDIGGY